jgi:hypothetical protein
MRQLSIAAFLAIIALFGTYYLFTEGLHLSTYYGPPAVQFPQNRAPRALPSITPGPAYRNEFSSGPAHTPKPKTQSADFAVRKAVPVTRVTAPPINAPVLPAITPMPAPTYAAVTPVAMPHTPTPITVPGFGAVTGPSASPSALPSKRATPKPTEPPKVEPAASPSDSPSPKS